MNPRILVTGAGGFVCSGFIPTLLQRGYDVIAVDRAFDAQLMDEWQTHWRGRVTIIESDTHHLPSTHVDALIHGAAITASPEENGQTPEENFRANIEPLLRALSWAAQQQVKRAIFLSSGAVYHKTAAGTAVDETTPTTPLGTYAVAKQTMESLVETLRTIYGRDLLSLRLSNIYGINEQPRATRPRVSLVGRLIDEAQRTGSVNVYENSLTRDWTFAPDLGKVIDAMLRLPKVKYAVYNAAAEHLLTQRDIASAIQAAIPDVKINVRAGSDPADSSATRLGYLSSQRLREETNFNDWTPITNAIKLIVGTQSLRLGAAPLQDASLSNGVIS